MKKGLLNLINKSAWDSPDPRVKSHLLVRDFIHTSLYGTFGYFTSHASILSPQPFDFQSFKDQDVFLSQIGKIYSKECSQVWHTPGEIFKPWFGNCITEYLVSKRKSDNMIIYEMGPGNGTLMFNILDTLKERYPHLYKNIEYTAIEISPKLIKILKDLKSKSQHSDKIILKNSSIFEWDKVEERECFFLGMEVLDNFAHDLIRYNSKTLEPYQGHVIETVSGDISEVYYPLQDPLLKRYLDLRCKTGYKSQNFQRRALSFMPFAPNMTQKEFIPTKSLEFLEILYKYFPKNSLLLSDFTRLDSSIPGIRGPVVQTMIDGVMYPCITYLVNYIR